METTEKLIAKLESVANFLRGMTLDPSIPDHVKEALKHKIKEIDLFVDQTDFKRAIQRPVKRRMK